ncbi:MAG: hypothetical protein NVV82_24205 [Sporocytophaga sp.]|nr:hypothetical protein [Sporocytophaga sp.]
METQLEIQIHDSYFTIAPILLFAIFFTSIVYLTYAAISLINKNSLTRYIILGSSNFALIIFLILFSRIIAQLELFGSDLTIYPPLSALPEAIASANDSKSYTFILNTITLIQSFLLVSLFLIGYLLGKFKNFNILHK